MANNSLLPLSVKALVIWLVLSGLGFYFQEAIGLALLPCFEVAVRMLAPGFSSSLKILQQNHDYVIELYVRLLQAVPVSSKLAFPAGKEFTASTHLMHALVPIVIEMTVLLTWPVPRFSQRLFLVAAGLVSALLICLLTTPTLLLGLIEINFQEAALSLNVIRPEPLVLTWMVYCEMGARWLLPVIAAIGCVCLQSLSIKTNKQTSVLNN
ncbi:MAG: hypothetical protein WC782_03230 [Methylococcaceae bacterium]|jgi:hypothetical protein